MENLNNILEYIGLKQVGINEWQKFIKEKESPVMNILVQLIDDKVCISVKYYRFPKDTIQSTIDVNISRIHNHIDIELLIDECVDTICQRISEHIKLIYRQTSNHMAELRLKHIHTGNIGVFLKEYYATGHGYLTQIIMDDGLIYYAPSFEYIRV